MAYSELQLYNLAVDAVGGTGTIETISEVSREAELCSRWFGPVRDKVLRAAHWQSAKAYQRLALRASRDEETWVTTYPTPAYSNAYSLPADALIPRFLTDFSRFDISVYDSSTHILSTTSPSPILCYTKRIDVNLMEESLAYAIAIALAAHICEPLTGATQKARMRLQEANEAILQARVETANTDNQPTSHIPDFISVRGYGTPALGNSFVYPYGELFMAGNIGG